MKYLDRITLENVAQFESCLIKENRDMQIGLAAD